jgi:uridine kinase
MALLIGVCGGSGSGKSTLANALAQEFGAPSISMDHYYLFGSERPARLGENFDHPDNFAWDKLLACAADLKAGRPVQRPIHDYLRGPQGFVPIPAASVVIFEGILMLHDPRIASLFDVRVHLETDLALQLKRRLSRDAAERGIPEAVTLKMWDEAVAPMHWSFVAPQKERAHASIDSGQPMEAMLAEAREAVLRACPDLRAHWTAPQPASQSTASAPRGLRP